MSLWKGIKKAFRPVSKVLKGAAAGGAFGPWGQFAASTIGGIKAARKGRAWPGGIQAAPGGDFGFGAMGFGPIGLPALGGIAARTLPAVGRAVGTGVAFARRLLNTPGGKWTRKAIRDAGLVVTGGLVFDAAGNLMGSVARRRMNPLNARALRRAIRRVKSARGICRDVESMLPRRKAAAPCPPRKRC